MALCVCLENLRNIDNAYSVLNGFGVVVNYDDVNQMNIKNRIIIGKVVKKYPIYRKVENKVDEGDCFVLELQKAYPKECLYQEKRIFRLIIAGDPIAKVQHVKVDSFLAFQNPKVLLSSLSEEPTFALDSGRVVFWEMPHLTFDPPEERVIDTVPCSKQSTDAQSKVLKALSIELNTKELTQNVNNNHDRYDSGDTDSQFAFLRRKKSAGIHRECIKSHATLDDYFPKDNVRNSEMQDRRYCEGHASESTDPDLPSFVRRRKSPGIQDHQGDHKESRSTSNDPSSNDHLAINKKRYHRKVAEDTLLLGSQLSERDRPVEPSTSNWTHTCNLSLKSYSDSNRSDQDSFAISPVHHKDCKFTERKLKKNYCNCLRKHYFEMNNSHSGYCYECRMRNNDIIIKHDENCHLVDRWKSNWDVSECAQRCHDVQSCGCEKSRSLCTDYQSDEDDCSSLSPFIIEESCRSYGNGNHSLSVRSEPHMRVKDWLDTNLQYISVRSCDIGTSQKNDFTREDVYIDNTTALDSINNSNRLKETLSTNLKTLKTKTVSKNNIPLEKTQGNTRKVPNTKKVYAADVNVDNTTATDSINNSNRLKETLSTNLQTLKTNTVSKTNIPSKKTQGNTRKVPNTKKVYAEDVNVDNTTATDSINNSNSLKETVSRNLKTLKTNTVSKTNIPLEKTQGNTRKVPNTKKVYAEDVNVDNTTATDSINNSNSLKEIISKTNIPTEKTKGNTKKVPTTKKVKRSASGSTNLAFNKKRRLFYVDPDTSDAFISVNSSKRKSNTPSKINKEKVETSNETSLDILKITNYNEIQKQGITERNDFTNELPLEVNLTVDESDSENSSTISVVSHSRSDCSFLGEKRSSYFNATNDEDLENSLESSDSENLQSDLRIISVTSLRNEQDFSTFNNSVDDNNATCETVQLYDKLSENSKGKDDSDPTNLKNFQKQKLKNENHSKEVSEMNIKISVQERCLDYEKIADNLTKRIKRKCNDSVTDTITDQRNNLSESPEGKTPECCIKNNIEQTPSCSQTSSQTYHDAEGSSQPLSQSIEFQDKYRMLSEKSSNSLNELFSFEPKEVMEWKLSRLKQTDQCIQIDGVIVNILPELDILNPLTIVKGVCRSSCQQSFSIAEMRSHKIRRRKCKHCKLLYHHICPFCKSLGIKVLLCMTFSFEMHVLYGRRVLSVLVSGRSAEIFLGSSLRHYLHYCHLSKSVIAKLNKVNISSPPEDWTKIPMLRLNLKTKTFDDGSKYHKVVGTVFDHSILRERDLISIEDL